VPTIIRACRSFLINYFPAGASLQLVLNSEFKIPFAARTLTHPITLITPIIARVAHTPRWRLFKKFFEVPI